MHISIPRVDVPAVKQVSDEEYRTLVTYLTTWPRNVEGQKIVAGHYERVRARAMFAILWDTGMRRSELARLELDDVDLDGRRILIRKSKSHKPRVVFITDETVAALLKYLRLRHYRSHAELPGLWIGPKGVLTSDGIREAIERITRAAGVNVSAHQFRRSMASRLLGAGMSQVSVQRQGGWAITGHGQPVHPQRGRGTGRAGVQALTSMKA